MKVSHSGRFQELWTFLQVQQQKTSSAMMKLALMRTATGKEDTELPLLQRISLLDLTGPQIPAQINVSQSSSNRHISTVQRRLYESDVHGWIAAKKLLLKDTNKKKRLNWAKKHEQWTLDWRKCFLWSGVQIGDFWIQPSCLCEMQGRWMDDLLRCSSHCEAWRRRCGGVGVLCW